MDLTGIIGLIISFALMLFFGLGSTSNIPLFIDVPSIAIVVGCTAMCLVCSYPPGFWKTLPGFLKMYILVQERDLPGTINTIISLAERGRREGLLALDNSLEDIKDPFLKKGIQLAVDAIDRAVIENVLEVEMEKIDERHKFNIGFFENMGAVAPAFGMFGTMIGLILMLSNMNDPTTIGPAMAICLITTFYGLILVNTVAVPIITKLKIRHTEEMAEKRVIMDGVLAVQAGENPKVMMYKLISHLDPSTRAEFEAAREKGKGKDEDA
ncbi:MAG: MotA/TolQ/ExbB proton channel family protein [Fibromonadaceae bacterium]|jgi:chemotaxis protein MotA|nr:MotA/TolQ/ExbB proton channel family protein [Fibromonadaceae bacterium]